MSYKDPRTGEWLAGQPPAGSNAVYLNTKGDQPTAAELRASELSAAELADVAPGTAWSTEEQTCIVLGIDARELYADAQLVGGARFNHDLGELLFDASDIARRIQKAERLARPDEDAEDVKLRADALLAELQADGLDPFGGGAAA